MLYLTVAIILILLVVPAGLLCLAGADPEGRGATLQMIGILLLILIVVGLIADVFLACRHYFH